MNKNNLIYEFKKNSLEKVIIRFSEFMRREVIDIRVFYKASEDKDDWRPTVKGLCMSSDLLPELKKGIDKAFKKRERTLGKRYKKQVKTQM